MVRLNKDYVELFEDLRIPKEGQEDLVVYALISNLNDFVYVGGLERAFWGIDEDPKNTLLIKGFSNMKGKDPHRAYPKYKLNINGLVVPEENYKAIEELKISFPEVARTSFAVCGLDTIHCFALRSCEPFGRGIKRRDYIITPEHKQFYEVLNALEAPKDLILK